MTSEQMVSTIYFKLDYFLSDAVLFLDDFHEHEQSADVFSPQHENSELDHLL